MTTPLSKNPDTETRKDLNDFLRFALLNDGSVNPNTLNTLERYFNLYATKQETLARIDELKKYLLPSLEMACIQLNEPMPLTWEVAVLRGLVPKNMIDRISSLQATLSKEGSDAI